MAEVVDQLSDAGIRISDDTIRRWIRTDRLPATKLVSGGWRVHPAAVEALKHGDDPHEAVRLANDTEHAHT